VLKAVKPDESKISTSDRSIVLVIIKADDAQEHWPRLLKSPGKVTNITVGILTLDLETDAQYGHKMHNERCFATKCTCIKIRKQITFLAKAME
jgi:hypothetical protein